MAMFSPQAEMQKTRITSESVSAEESRCAITADFEINTALVNEPLPESLVGDQMRLKQILINLVKNALKFTRTGLIRIISSYDAESELFQVHIIDSGKGIKPEDIDKLFTLFGKLHRTAEMNSEGIGMGLMICQHLVKMNEGTIQVQSHGEDKGSRFTFTMRMKPSPSVADENEPGATQQIYGETGGLAIAS